MNNHLFLCHSNFHVFQSKEILKKIENGKFYLAHENLVNPSYFKGFDDSIKLENTLGSVRNKKCNLIAVSQIKKFCERKKVDKIYLSDIDWPLNNLIFFDRFFVNIEFIFISDGIGSYFDKRVSLPSYLKMVLKFTSSMLGFSTPYRPFYGHYLGYSQKRVNKIYALNVEKIAFDGIKENLYLNHDLSAISTSRNRVLILSQPMWILWGWDKWIDYVSKQVAYVKLKHPNNTLLVKMHHRSDQREIEEYLKLKIKVINDNVCAEEYVVNNNVGYVYSYLSSALLHIKWVSGELISVTSIIDTNVDSEENRDTVTLLSHNGVNIVEV
ncbi:polysialyltransferase family glycosyltransferase [Vibrio sp. 10N.286.49.F3]|uniref:polysialyltransferase family glycosyltransferase n=1 Tax=Vibrio sp. 10N.286.49.F3 TaxID=3229704 RepID=UPI0035520513